MEDIRNIAYYIINQAAMRKYELTNSRLQAILYFSQALHIQEYGSLIFADQFTCWKRGPVQADLYDDYKLYSCLSIPPIKSVEVVEKLTLVIKPFDYEPPATVADVILRVFHQTNHLSTATLINIMQRQAPWRMTYCHNQSVKMSNQTLINYFKGDQTNGTNSKHN